MKQELEERRKKLMGILESLIESATEIIQEMDNLPYKREVSHIILKPNSGMYIVHVHGDEGFTAGYQSKHGGWYRIDIHENPSIKTKEQIKIYKPRID